MADYSKMSDSDLLALVSPPKPDYSQMSDADLMKAIGPQQAENSLAGSAKAIGSGLLNAALSNLPGVAVQDAFSGGLNAGSRLGAYIMGKDQAAPAPAAGSLPQLKAGLESATGLKDYKSQTSLEGYLKTGAEFAPALAAPGSIPRKIAQTFIPAIASETAGQATEGTAAEPYARVAAGVAGGLLSARGAGAPQAAIPTAAQSRAAATANYQHPEVAAVQFRPSAVETWVDRIEADLNRRGQFNTPEIAGATHGVIARLRNPANATQQGLPPGVVTMPEVRAVQSALSTMTTELNSAGRPTANAVAANRANQALNRYMDNIAQPDLFAGNAQRARTLIREANQDWASQAKSELVGIQQMKADRQAGRSGSGSNIENSMRQKIDSAFGPGKVGRVGLAPPEVAAVDRLVEGSFARNALRKFGKLGFNDGLTLMAHAAAALPSAGLSIPLGIAATAARKVGEGMTRRDIAALDRMIRSRSAEAQRWAVIQARINAANPQRRLSAPQAGLLGGVLAAQPAGLLSRLSF